MQNRVTQWAEKRGVIKKVFCLSQWLCLKDTEHFLFLLTASIYLSGYLFQISCKC